MPRVMFLQDCELRVCRNVDVYYLRVPRLYDMKRIHKGEILSVEFLEGNMTLPGT